MADVEALSMQAMEIVTYAGMAKSNFINALKQAKLGGAESALQSLKEGDHMMAQAHESHFGLLQKEVQTGEPQVSLLILHAEDQLMACETIRLLVTEFIEFYHQKSVWKGGKEHDKLL